MQIFPNSDSQKILLLGLIQKKEYLQLIQICPICIEQPDFRISGIWNKHHVDKTADKYFKKQRLVCVIRQWI